MPSIPDEASSPGYHHHHLSDLTIITTTKTVPSSAATMTPSSTDISRAASSHSGHEQEDKKSTKTASDTIDGEKAAAVAAGQEVHDVEAAEVRPLSGPRALLLRAQAGLLAGVEVRGMSPVPPEERTVTRYSNVFSIWFCISVSLLP